MAGLKVTRDQIDIKSAEAVMAVREAFDKIKTLQAFLESVPVENGVDPLCAQLVEGSGFLVEGNSTVEPFGYTEDEAYLIRYVVGTLDNLDVTDVMAAGRKLTGLS